MPIIGWFSSQPADELKIEATADAPVYKPGDDARIRFRVTNARGEGVQAALGLQVVDEAVFALAEKQPGFAKVFFYLEQEAMKPRYEIHSIGMPEIVEPVAKAQAEQRDRAARALFSATEMVSTNKFETEFGRTVPQTKYAEYAARYRTQFLAQVRQGLSRAYEQNRGDVTQNGWPELRDAWDTVMRIEHATWNPAGKYYLVRSAGPDRRFDTADDLAAYMEMRTGNIVGRPGSGNIDLKIEHDRGPFNGLAEIAGSVVDQLGAGLGGAVVEVREISTGKARTARTNAAGQFSLAAIPAGEYVSPSDVRRVPDGLARDHAERARSRGGFRHSECGRGGRSGCGRGPGPGRPAGRVCRWRPGWCIDRCWNCSAETVSRWLRLPPLPDSWRKIWLLPATRSP